MQPEPLINPKEFDTSKTLYGIEEIQRFNPQRFEMEQLTAIVHLDVASRLIVGYKDVGWDEFWIKGHLPGYPVMPGVLICEAAAQLSSFCCHKLEYLPEGFFVFGGLRDVRVWGPVRPGDRLVLAGRAEQRRRGHRAFLTQAYVGSKMIYQGTIIGVHLTGATQERNRIL